MEARTWIARYGRIGCGIAAGGLVALATYLLWIRPWHLRWGATDEEVARALPGDAIVKQPSFDATRAITIKAQPEEVWPWLVQAGCQRAGWYSYDWIDNLGTPSAERIIPAFQSMKVGDIVPMSPDGKQGLTVELIDRNRFMLWASKDKTATWAWGLFQSGPSQTRLVTRVRIRYRWNSASIAFSLLFDPGDFFMMRKMLLGLKRRAEGASNERTMVRRSP
jgi:hypothetical protein